MAIGGVGGLDGSAVVLRPSRGPGCLMCPQERLKSRNYCRSCGNKLHHPCEKKQVTVLFIDVSGFTALSERLDPERVREIMEQTFEVVLDAVHGHDGTVNQFLGDGVMALFGEAPGEHHASRALGAALAIQERLEPVRREVRRSHGLVFRVRMAVNTGTIVVGTIGTDLRTDYTATSDTTSVASRLLGMARPDQIVVTGRTRVLAAGRFVFEECEEGLRTESCGAVDLFTLTRETPADVEPLCLAEI